MPRQRKPIPKISAKKLAANPSLQFARSTITPSSSPPSATKRKAKPRAVNRKRKAKAFAHAYHSVERVEFVKSLPCAIDDVSIIAILACDGQTENAHTGKRPGAGLKAHYSTIAPLCHWHHARYDRREGIMLNPKVRAIIVRTAAKTETLWLAHCAGESQ